MLKNLKGNFYGGITASVVALPLALAFGVASGAGAIAGVYGAIIVGFFASIFGGTATQISGPTGPMTIVMAGVISFLITKYPDDGIALAFTTVMLGGIVQILLGYFKIGRFISFVPYTVVSGFMNGIGIIIIILQILPFLGVENTAHTPTAVITSLPSEINHFNYSATLLSSTLLAVLLIWPSSWDRYLPSPLLVLIAGTLSSIYIFEPENFIRIGEIPTDFLHFQMPLIKLDVILDMIKYAIVLGALGSIDSLLTSLVADGMTRTEHNSDKELIGQGIGNLIAGTFGGLPGAGATMRTVINIRSGGTSLLSGVIHSVSLIIMIDFASGMISTIPMVALSAILVKVGLDIIDWNFLRRLYRAPASSISIVSSVFFLTVFVDLITAVGTGVVIASLYTLNRLTKEQLKQAKLKHGADLIDSLNEKERKLLDNLSDDILLYTLSGPFTFGAAKGISRKLVSFTTHKVLILDLLNVPSIDTSTALSIEDIIKSHHEVGRFVVLVCNDELRNIFEKLEIVKLIGSHKLFSNREKAFIKAKNILEEQILK